MIRTLMAPCVSCERLRHLGGVQGLLHWAANHDPPFHALIDSGALVTGLSNYEVARRLLEEGLAGMEGCVYLDQFDRKMVVLRGVLKPMPLHRCGVRPENRFTFYDQVSIHSHARTCGEAHAHANLCYATPGAHHGH